jgi:hypothetical protein
MLHRNKYDVSEKKPMARFAAQALRTCNATRAALGRIG